VASEFRRIDNQGQLHEDWDDPIAPALVISAEQAARQMLGAIAQRRPELIMSPYGKVAAILAQNTLWLFTWLTSTFNIRVKSPGTTPQD
jgi:hypothetical protein